MNKNLEQVLTTIKENDHLLVTSHINPDGDAIGSALSLFNIFKNITRISLYNYSKKILREFDFLPGFDKIRTILPYKFDLLIVLDSASLQRVKLKKPNCLIINIDHHQSNTNFGDFNFVDFSRPSCAEVVYEFLQKNDFTINKPSALSLYSAIVSDTQSFSTDRVDAKTFDIVAKLLQYDIDISSVSNLINKRRSLAKARLLGIVLSSFELVCEGRVAIFAITKEIQQQTQTSVVDSEGIADELLKCVSVEVSILFFKNGDAKHLAKSLDRLLQDAALRNRLIQKGRKTVEKYRSSSIAKRYLRLFKSCI
jgi:phosphoesterase RecJ-like protein